MQINKPSHRLYRCLPFLFGLCLTFALLWPTPAHAYIGPAIALIGYLLGPVFAVIAAIGMVLYFPAKILLRKMRAKKKPNPPEESLDDTP